MVNDAYLQAVSDGFDFITAPMFHPRYRRDTLGISETREAPATRKFGHIQAANLLSCGGSNMQATSHVQVLIW
jgi:hypothetical protein